MRRVAGMAPKACSLLSWSSLKRSCSFLSLSVSIGLPNLTVGETWNAMRKQRHGDSLGGPGTPQPSSRLATMLNNPASYLGAPAHIRRLEEASRGSALGSARGARTCAGTPERIADLTCGPVCVPPHRLVRPLKARLPALAANTVDAVPLAEPTACLRQAQSPARSNLSGFSHILSSVSRWSNLCHDPKRSLHLSPLLC